MALLELFQQPVLHEYGHPHRLGHVAERSGEVGRPGADVAKAMSEQKVYIGRVWPIWPTKVRVTVGTQEEMDKFKAALDKVMS